jgi:hypothetical protein
MESIEVYDLIKKYAVQYSADLLGIVYINWSLPCQEGQVSITIALPTWDRGGHIDFDWEGVITKWDRPTAEMWIQTDSWWVGVLQ